VRAEYHDRDWRVNKRIPGELAAYLAFSSLVLFVLFGNFFLPPAIVSGVIHWLRIYNIKLRLAGFRDIL
jgi:hypothetical protein